MSGRYRLCRLPVLSLFACAALFVQPLLAQQQELDQNRVMAGVRFDGKTSVVSVVVEGGPADLAGIHVGDEILSIDEKFILQPVDVIFALNGRVAGERVRLEVRRDNQFLFFDLTLINAVNGDTVITSDGKAVPAPIKPAILNELAPELTLDNWHGWSGDTPPRLREMKGRVICLLLFQSDCEFSRRFGVPQFKQLHARFADDPMVQFLAIQTPFRNFEANTRQAGIRMFNVMNVDIPLSHDGSAEKRTVTYDAYRAPGTPWIVVIDKRGVVRFNDSRLPVEDGRELIAKLKMEVN